MTRMRLLLPSLFGASSMPSRVAWLLTSALVLVPLSASFGASSTVGADPESTFVPPGYAGSPSGDARHPVRPQKLPGRLQCELYDRGGPGFAFFDSDEENSGSGGLNPLDGSYLNGFRADEAVDISYTKDTGDTTQDFSQYNRVTPDRDSLYVGWTEAGEWLSYTVVVDETGTYSLDVMYTSNGDGAFEVSIDGVPRGTVTLPTTNDPEDPVDWRQWHHWNEVIGGLRLELPAGRHLVRVEMLADNVNLDSIDFRPASPPGMKTSAGENPPARVVELSGEVLRDRIRGGLLGQILGNLNGLEHENEYIDEPGNVLEFTPALPDGARTDDDTDLEWVYIVAMQDEDRVLLPPARIAELWRERINRRIWCSNRYARHLMDLGLEPPLTGSQALNPWAEFNISGQFLSETFGLIAPGMPQTASRIGLNYTRVAIDAEPAQTTQLFCSMIARAFVTNDFEEILETGVAALDPQSRVRQIVADVRRWHRQNPDDWRATRRLLEERYTQAGGGMRDRNGYDLMTGSTIAALLYGHGDLPETLRTAFNFGWDADNSAATAGAVVGTVKGYRSMMSRGWRIVDRYRNTTRDRMPQDETITSFADRLVDLAEKVILEQGGERVLVRGRPVYRIQREQPANVYPLSDLKAQRAQMRTDHRHDIESSILEAGSRQDQARAAYLAICLDLAGELAAENPGAWQKAVQALEDFPRVAENLFDEEPGTSAQAELQARATSAGLEPPSRNRQEP